MVSFDKLTNSSLNNAKPISSQAHKLTNFITQQLKKLIISQAHKLTNSQTYKLINLPIIVITLLFSFTPLLAQQRGKASFYSKRATGARTSSGQRIHHDSLTCAHRTYPFGTLLKVKNLSNGKEVIVKVTDRGPFGRKRIIDLSWAAAQQLGMLSQGVATVEITPVSNVAVSFRNEEPEKLPEIDLEVPTKNYKTTNPWRKKSKKKKRPLRSRK